MIERLRRSMLVHLAAAFALGMLLLMAALMLFLGASMRRAVHAQVDREILDATKITLHRLGEDHYPIDKELLDLGDNLFLRVLDPSGKVLLEHREMARVAPLAAFPLPARSGTWTDSGPGSPPKVRLLAVACAPGWIQVARDMHPEEQVLQDFRRSLVVALGAVPFLGSLLGYLLVKLGLRPLRTIARSARAVGPESLVLRLDPHSLPLELEPLCQELDRTFHRLEEGFSRLTALNGDLAHEMRTPLHALQLELERLLARRDLDLELAEALAELAETAAHLGHLLEQMLFLARVEDPSRHLERQEVDPARLLEQARAPFLALAEERGVRIALEVSGRALLHGDPTLLRRALHNLLSNALRHSLDGGLVELRATGHAQGTFLEVEDQGPGLPSAIRDRIGQRFLRLEASRDRATGGTGLGLAIVQGIAQLHGATLSFPKPGRPGCRARITFPRT